jgi:hypothetical protein
MNCTEIVNDKNITEFVFVCLSAFLGFLSAIGVERLQKKKEEKNNKRILLQSICKEMANIKTDAIQLDKDLYYLSPLEKPFWESAVYSGDISLIANMEIYPKMLNIYAMVDAINRWENMKTQIFYTKGSFSQTEITNSITKHISDLCEAITDMETILNKYNK